ncbi:MAG: Sir2 family NAD-dependent protein deacetylase [Ilumatobacteraceae bacterium]
MIEDAARAIADAERIVVLTGAGISTDSGIPDFRGPKGIWTKNPAAEKASHISHYLDDPEVRRAAWLNRLDAPIWTAEPNLGHRCVYELERRGRLLAVVTQNVDGLHQAAGNDPGNVIEVHGTVRYTRCWNCDDRRPMRETLDRVRAGEADPPCLVCGGILKSDTISFGQSLVPEVIDRALRERRVRRHAGDRVDAERVPGGELRADRQACRRRGDHRQRTADRDGPPRRPPADRPDRRHPSRTRAEYLTRLVGF